MRHSTLLFDAITRQDSVALEFMLTQQSYPHEARLHGRTPLNHASCFSSVAVVDLLIKHGAGVDEMDQEGDWPLQAAIWSENEGVVRYLLSRGANPDLFNDAGLTCDGVAEDRFPAALDWLAEVRAQIDAQAIALSTPRVQMARTKRL